MDKTLLLGNGLNRTLSEGFSWEDLMAKLDNRKEEDSNVPFPIRFEQIAARRGCRIGKRRNDPYKELREEIADEVSSFKAPNDAVHAHFVKLPFQHVVTTNYDQVFEGFFRGLTSECTNPGSSRNILGAIWRANDVDFYHAHGIDKWKNTLCLGHEHYASLIGKIRNAFYPNGEDENSLLDDLVKGNIDNLRIWPEYLFTSNVAIVGLGLDYCETDLWWLLALRAAVFSSHNKLMNYENQIIYYRPKIQDSTKTNYELGHTEALESLGIEVRDIEGKDYKDAYKNIADSISEDWSK